MIEPGWRSLGRPEEGQPQALPEGVRLVVLTLQRAILGLARHWLLVLNLALGLFVVLPWLAPVFMRHGWEPAGRAIYTAYSYTCHQLPQRSYFLFGPKLTYSLAELQAAYPVSDPDQLRAFVGTREMGYKVAYAHRLSAIYAAVLASSLLFALLRRRLRPPSLRLYLLLVTPMFLDGMSHLLTDVALVDWRATNAWASWLGQSAGPGFYTENFLGSLNWLLRTLTGALFGGASAWLVLPYVEAASADMRQDL